MRKHYLYRHIRLDTNQPFYIGIGTKGAKVSGIKTEYKRAFQIKDGRSNLWYKIYNKCDRSIDIEILMESDSWDEIINKEREFIALYGRMDINTGILANLTDGGEGVVGVISKKKGIALSPETKAKLRDANLGKVQSEESNTKRRDALKGKPFSEEHKRKLRLGNKQKDYSKIKMPPCSEEKKAKLRISLLGKNTGSLTQDHKDAISAGNKLAVKEGRRKYIVTEETVNKIRQSTIGRVHSEETKLKMSLSRKQFLNDNPIIFNRHTGEFQTIDRQS
jgi:hypothetical protein